MHRHDTAARLRFHLDLLLDRSRLDLFRRAIAAAVRPGDTVLDLGAGSGILSFFACRAGARKVYAIESGPEVELARVLAERNDSAGRIEVIEARSQRVTLPKPADVAVSDTFGCFGVDGGIHEVMCDARARLLKPGGRLVPAGLGLLVAPVHVPSFEAELAQVDSAAGDVDLAPIRACMVNNLHPVDLGADSFLAEPALLCRTDWTPGALGGEARFELHRDGSLSGLAGFFSATLAPGVEITNRPGARNVEYRAAFFPLERPVRVSRGEAAAVSVRNLVAADLWEWRVCTGRETFEQTNLRGFPLSREVFARSAASYRPSRSRLGDAELFVLQSSDSTRDLSGIEADLVRLFPDLFPTPTEAAYFVRRVVERLA
jgi:SAM-dependent methyltransferase